MAAVRTVGFRGESNLKILSDYRFREPVLGVKLSRSAELEKCQMWRCSELVLVPSLIGRSQ